MKSVSERFPVDTMHKIRMPGAGGGSFVDLWQICCNVTHTTILYAGTEQ